MSDIPLRGPVSDVTFAAAEAHMTGRLLVTQPDRDAAADLGVELGWAATVVHAVRTGQRDYWPSVQSYAHVRITLTEQHAKFVESFSEVGLGQPAGEVIREIAKALREGQANA